MTEWYVLAKLVVYGLGGKAHSYKDVPGSSRYVERFCGWPYLRSELLPAPDIWPKCKKCEKKEAK